MPAQIEMSSAVTGTVGDAHLSSFFSIKSALSTLVCVGCFVVTLDQKQVEVRGERLSA
jgi:hypothetical protein